MEFAPIKKVYDMEQSKTFHHAVLSAKYFVEINYGGSTRIIKYMIYKYVDAHLCYILNLFE